MIVIVKGQESPNTNDNNLIGIIVGVVIGAVVLLVVIILGIIGLLMPSIYST